MPSNKGLTLARLGSTTRKLERMLSHVQSGGEDEDKLLKFKTEATEIMKEGGFQLHKWHSNAPGIEELDTDTNLNSDHSGESSTYAKQAVGTKPNETKILETAWKKDEDQLSFNLARCLGREEEGPLTKRKMLSTINCIFDLLGIVSPFVIVGKILYSQVCLKKLRWDERVPEEIQRPWNKWLKAIEEKPSISVPRSVVDQGVTRLVLHGFLDASYLAVSAVIYVLAFHAAMPVKQNLLAAKCRVAPRNLSIPRKELVAAHMLSRLMSHIKVTLQNQPIDEYHCWVDSTTVLHWIKGQGTWSQFFRNRTEIIQEKNYLQWHHVPTSENPSDQGSRGVGPHKLK